MLGATSKTTVTSRSGERRNAGGLQQGRERKFIAFIASNEKGRVSNFYVNYHIRAGLCCCF